MPQNAILRALHPGPLHTEQRLDGAGCLIGRDGRSVGIALHGPRVSRRHCWIGLNPQGEWLIKDLDSTNGIFVNGQRIEGQSVLSSHDVIGLGRSRSADYEFLVGDQDESMRARELEGTGPWLIGRDLLADISLPADPVVSQRHARLARLPEGMIIEDLGSHNGTWVDGKRVRRARLEPEQQIVIGNTELELQHAGQGRPAFVLRTTRRAVGLNAFGLTLTTASRPGVDFEIPAGGLRVLDSSRIGSAETLIEVISGQRAAVAGRLQFSEPSLDDHAGHRRDRLGATLNDAEPGNRQTMGEWMMDQAYLALDGDLSPQRLHDLVITTLEAMQLGDLADKTDASLSPLHRCLFRVASALLTRPSLLLVNPDIVDGMDSDSVNVLVERLRALAGSTLTLVVITDKPPARLEAGEAIQVHAKKKPGGAIQSGGPAPVPRRISTTVTAIVLRLCLGPWRQLSGILPEALILPLILLPGLWFALPGHPPIHAAVLTVTISAALASATLVSRGHLRLLPLARRHLLLGDVILALLMLGSFIALAQLIVVQFVLLLTSTMSVSSGLALVPALALAALSSVALGMMCGVVAGPRVLVALLLAAGLTMLQVMVIGWMQTPEAIGPITRRLADLSGAFWSLNLYQISLPTAGLAEIMRPLAFLAGQIVLFLALTRTALRRRIQAA